MNAKKAVSPLACSNPRRYGKNHYSRTYTIQLPSAVDDAFSNLKKDFPALSSNALLSNLIAESLEKYHYLTPLN